MKFSISKGCVILGWLCMLLGVIYKLTGARHFLFNASAISWFFLALVLFVGAIAIKLGFGCCCKGEKKEGEKGEPCCK
jgi:hypothetical protein